MNNSPLSTGYIQIVYDLSSQFEGPAHQWAALISDQFSTPEQWCKLLMELGVSGRAAGHFIVELITQGEHVWRN